MGFSKSLIAVFILSLLAVEVAATYGWGSFFRPRRSWRRRRSCYRRRHSNHWICRYRKKFRVNCPVQPSSGCFQSDNVTFAPTAVNHPDFIWYEPAEDYDLDLARPALGLNNRRYALCVYDGDSVDQDEDQAPLDSGTSLVITSTGPEIEAIAGSNLSFKVSTGFQDYTWTDALNGTVTNPIVQLVSMDGGDFSCWGKTISIALPQDNLPEDPSTYGYTPLASNFRTINSSLIDLVGVGLRAGEKTVQDRMNWAAQYYNAHSDQTDGLDMQEFILEQGPLFAWYDTITTLDISTNEGEDLSEDAGLFHTFAHYAATIVQRDIFTNVTVQFQTGDAESYLSYAIPLGLRTDSMTSTQYQSVIFDNNFFKNPDSVASVGGNVLDAHRTYGLIAGWLLAAIRQGNLDGNPPDTNFISCGAWDSCTPPVLPSNCMATTLVPCTFDLDYLPITDLYNDFSVLKDEINNGNEFNGAILDNFWRPQLVNTTGNPEYQEMLDAMNEGFSLGFGTFTAQQDEEAVAIDSFPSLYAFASGQLQFVDVAIQFAMIADTNEFNGETLFNIVGGDSIVTSLFFRRAFETAFSRFTASPPTSPSIPTWEFGVTPDVSSSV